MVAIKRPLAKSAPRHDRDTRNTFLGARNRNFKLYGEPQSGLVTAAFDVLPVVSLSKAKLTKVMRASYWQLVERHVILVQGIETPPYAVASRVRSFRPIL